MPGRAAPPAPAAPKAAPPKEGGPGAAAEGEGARPALDTQGIHETAARTVHGAQKLFGNLAGFIREAQSAVAESWEGAGAGSATPEASAAASKRREIARSDAAQYFVEYK